MKKSKIFIPVFIIFLFVFETNLAGQVPISSSLDFTSKTVEENLKNYLADNKLSEEKKKSLKSLAEKIKNNLSSLEHWRDKIESYQKIITSAPAEINEYKNISPVPEEKPDFNNISLASLELEQDNLEKELDRTAKKQNLLNKEFNNRAERRIAIPKKIIDIKSKLDKLQTEYAEISKKETEDEISLMQSMRLRSEIQSSKKEIETYEKELRMYDATIDLIPLKQDFLNKKSIYLKDAIAKLNKRLTEKRKEEVQKLALKTKTKTPVHPALKELAEKNQELAAQLAGPDGIVSKLDNVTRESDRAMKKLENIDKLFSDIKNKIEATGMTPALGLYMRNKKESFSNLDFYLQDRRNIMAEIQTELLQLEDERNDLSDTDAAVKQLLTKYNGKLAEPERSKLTSAAGEIIDLRKDLLDKMIKNLNLYFIELVELDTYQRLLISKIDQFEIFVDEYLIWYRSAPRLTFRDFQSGLQFSQCLLKPQEWDDAVGRIYTDLKKETFLYSMVLFFLLLLIFLHKKLNSSINTLSELVKNYETDSIGATFRGIIFSVLSILPLPVLLIFIGWRLNNELGVNLFINGLAHGFLKCGFVLLTLRTMNVFCKPGGVGDIHFKWNSESLALIRKHLKWFTPLIIITVFLGALFSSLPSDNLINGKAFHRLIFVFRMLSVSCFVFLVINPSRGPVRRFLDKRKGGIAERFKYLWYFPGIIYLVLGGLAILGYFYTAQQFNFRLQISLLLFMLMAFVYGLSSRWLIYVRRKLALERVRKKQEAMELSQQKGEDSIEAEEPVMETESLYSMGQDTKKILAISIFIIALFSLWFIWQDLFPALNMFNRINLWSTTQAVTESVSSQDGASSVQSIQKMTFVTLGDLFLSIIILLLTFIIVQNISGIIQMFILQHLKLDQGTRFAIITITRYAIVLIGILLACTSIGLTWSKLQWLVAAVSVGLGFGLQEIFANFISGLIILLEQPIRVGDVVTVGEVTGSVTQIKIRATTITDWNKKELIVPNKEFITNRLVNWSLSDKVIRMTVPVGIAYGSDTRKAEKILYKVAKDLPDILADPAPTVLFDAFGESSLTFELRVFIPSFDYYIQIRHDLHMNIDVEFRKAGIEIAFPQHDIHIRSIEQPLNISKK